MVKNKKVCVKFANVDLTQYFASPSVFIRTNTSESNFKSSLILTPFLIIYDTTLRESLSV